MVLYLPIYIIFYIIFCEKTHIRTNTYTLPHRKQGNGKRRRIRLSSLFYGVCCTVLNCRRASWIRTNGMQGSKPCALPLGDSPILHSFFCEKRAPTFIRARRVGRGTRTLGLQNHNLAR